MSKYTTVLFDFDYTLADSSDGIVRSMQYAFGKMGIPMPSEEAIRKTIGMSLEEAFVLLGATDDSATLKSLRELFVEEAGRVMCLSSNIYEDTLPTLTELSDMGYNVGIVSAKDRTTIGNIARRGNFFALVKLIIGEGEVNRQKPYPDQLYAAAEHFKAAACDTVYVGDSISDALAAKNAGVDFIAVATGATGKAELAALPHVAVVDRLKDILKYV